MRLPPAARALGQRLGRALAHPLARWTAAGLLLALAGVFLLGPTPGSVARELPPAAGWTLSAPPSFDAAAVAARRAAAPLWASQPAVAPPEMAGAVLAAPPRLLAIVSGSPGQRQAVFEWPDGRRVRLGPGDRLDGEGIIETVSATRVRWQRANGTVVDSSLFLDPEPRVVPQ